MWAAQSAFMISHILLAVANWALLTLVARTFSLAQTGEYNLALAALTPLFLLFSLQSRNRFLSEKRDLSSSFSDYFYSRALFIPVILLSAVGLQFGLNIPGAFYWAVFLLKLSESVFELPFAFCHKAEGAGKAAIVQSIRVLGTYGFIVAILYRRGSILEAFIIGALFSMIFSLGIFHFSFKGVKTRFKFDWDEVKKYIKSSTSLGIAGSILALNVSLPRFFLDFMAGADAVAIYSVSFAFYSLWQLFFNSYFNAVLPRFSSLSLARKFAPLILLLLFSFLFLWQSQWLYSRLFGPQYEVASSLNGGLLISVLISFFSSYFYYEHLGRGALGSHLKINLMAFATNLLILYPCIRLYGPSGAFYAWALALMVQCSLYYQMGKRVLHKGKNAS